METQMPERKSRRGFAGMSEEKQSEISSMGGIAVHKKGTGHEFTPEEACVAGLKGVKALKKKYGRGLSEHMSRIGKLGGERSKQQRARSRAGQ